MKKPVVILGAMLLLAATIVGVRSFRARESGDVLLLSGTVEVTENHLAFKIPGKIARLFTDEGKVASRGEKLAQIETAELESALHQSMAMLKEAEARVADLRRGSRSQEIEQAAALLKAAEAEAGKAAKDYERAERLKAAGAISDSQFDAFKNAYEIRNAQVRSSGEHLSLVREGPRREEFLAAEARVSQARALLAGAESRLSDAALLSPADGVILRKAAEEGDVVAPGMPVFTLGDLARPWIKVYVKEDRIGRLRLGQEAQVSVDSYPGKTYQGTISFISSEAEFTPKSVQTREERVKLVFGVKVQVRNDQGELKPGMPADVRITLK